MMHWLTVFRYEIRQQLRRKGYLFVTFGVPLIAMLLFFGYQLYKNATDNGEDQPKNPITEDIQPSGKLIGYVDLTRDRLFPAPDSYEAVSCSVPEQFDPILEPYLIKRISSPYCWGQRILYYDALPDAEDALKNDDIDALYVVEIDYVDTGHVSQYMSGFNIEAATSDDVFTGYLLSSMLYEVDDVDTYERLFLRLRDPAVIVEHKVAASGATAQENETQNFVLVYAFGLIMMLSIFWGGGYLMQSVVQEKESRIIEIILSSVRPLPLLAGKILAMGALALLQVVTLIGTFVFLASQVGDIIESLGDIEAKPEGLVVMAIYFVLGFLLFGGLMACIAALSTTLRESQNFIVVITLPAMIPFFFLTIFAEEPNSTLAATLSMVPITAPLSMVMRTAVADVPLGEIALSIILLLLAVAFVIWLSGRFFRVNTLLMGKMPRLRDLPKLLRG